MATTRRRSSAEPGELDTSTLTEGERAVWQMPINPTATPALIDDEPEQTAVDRIAIALQTAGADERSRIKLYRINPISKKREWCEDYTPAEFEAGGDSLIRRAWGAGDYEVVVYGPIIGKGGKPGFGRMAIGYTSIAPAAAGADAPAHGGSSELSRALEAMVQMQQQAQAAQAQFQQSIMQALAERPDPSTQMRETLTLMTMMRSAMGLDQQSKSTVGELVGALKELRDAKDVLMPERETPDTSDPMSMLPGIIDLVKTAATQRQVQPPVTAPIPPLPPIQLPPAMQQPLPVSQPLPADPAPLIDWEALKLMLSPRDITKLRMLVPELLQRAVDKADPQDTAELIAEAAPDPLLDLIETDDWLQMLLHVMPPMEAHKEWLMQVREAYMALPADEEPENGAQNPTEPVDSKK
jgi:hypothetical protein